MTPPLCTCPEPEAAFPEDYPDRMHTHDGCAVYHRGKVCTMQPALPLESR